MEEPRVTTKFSEEGIAEIRRISEEGLERMLEIAGRNRVTAEKLAPSPKELLERLTRQVFDLEARVEELEQGHRRE